MNPSRQPKYLPYFEKLNALQTEFGFPPFEGKPIEKIRAYRDRLREEFGLELPEDYVEFLQRADGFAENGVVFYAIDQDDESDQLLPGLLAENAEYQEAAEELREYLVLGHSDLYLYAYHLPTRSYRALEEDTLEIGKEFEDFEDLMTCVLKYEVLGLFEEDEEGSEEATS
ncbi:YrhA family protein [Candidatus Methylacidithermus pantelleriae]|uniref:Knr4/Smi1-like domain-containing protein n=1 Tax=Candidatus Methylacidithermus pantelleriae TaxID=2744239 RepID=A0A8J2FTF7_9BACT|nr:YrhA family protein [Candidatus Methylacidithermus pantelleriae]CAF0702284.1 hypothetical protein MPNT_50023 [Candidatus Methylacidithermus pantelleriae]